VAFDGHGTAQDPWVVDYWSIELTRTECSRKELDGITRRGPEVGEECNVIVGEHIQSIRGDGNPGGGGDGYLSQGSQKAS
jgi:hypothetical protein